MKKLAQGFNTAAQDSNPGSRSRESEALPLSHCTLCGVCVCVCVCVCVWCVCGVCGGVCVYVCVHVHTLMHGAHA